MRWVDKNTAFMRDTTIVLFKNRGIVEVYPPVKWMYRLPIKTEFGFCHLFNFKNKKMAKQVFVQLDKLLNQ